jgi:hypothetical protein
MAEINIDNTGEVLSRRDVRRNSSNQIISYTLPDDSNKGYGLQRIPAQTTVFGLTSYDRTIDKISGELLDNIPDIGLRYTKKFTFNESGTEAVLFTNEKPDSNMESFVREGAAQIDRIQGTDNPPTEEQPPEDPFEGMTEEEISQAISDISDSFTIDFGGINLF